MRMWPKLASALALWLAALAIAHADLPRPPWSPRPGDARFIPPPPPREVQAPLEIKGQDRQPIRSLAIPGQDAAPGTTPPSVPATTTLVIPRKVVGDLLGVRLKTGSAPSFGPGISRHLPALAAIGLILAAAFLVLWRLRSRPRLALCGTFLAVLPICMCTVSCFHDRSVQIIDARWLPFSQASANTLSGRAVVYFDGKADSVQLKLDSELLEQLASGKTVHLGSPVPDTTNPR